MSMHRWNGTLTICLLAVALAAAKSSKVVMSWKNPNHTSSKKFQRVLALGLSDKTGIRADFEDALAAQACRYWRGGDSWQHYLAQARGHPV